MCLSNPVHISHRAPQRYHHRRRNLSNLTYLQRLAPSQIVVAGGLWNCQSAVQKADIISALASLHFLHFLALTETWITPENSATLAALSSAFSFIPSLRRLGRGGGTGLLMSREWRFTPLSFSTLSISSFEFHAITVSFPTKRLIIVIFHPPGPLDHFIDKFDILLSQFPIEGNPLILLGDRLHSSCILPLLTAFDLTLNHCPPTHKVTNKAGNVLDLLFTHNTTLDIAVTPLHISDHHFLSFSLPSSSFHPVLPKVFLLLPSQSALHNSLFPYFYYFTFKVLPTCSLTNRNTSPLKERTKDCREAVEEISPRFRPQFIPASDPHKLFTIFSSLLNPPPPSSLTPEDFITFFEEKVAAIHQSFSAVPTSPNNVHSPTSSSLTSFSPLTSDEILQLLTSSNPTTCPLDPIPSNLFQTICFLSSLSSSTTPSGSSGYVPTAFKKARVVPILKKGTLDGSNVTNYRLVSLLSFLSKALEGAIYNQLSLFLTQNQLNDPNQSGYKPANSTETSLIAVTGKRHAAKQSSILRPFSSL
ncbi:hypothetical protein P4O66_012485 [Electrophorus voltai]|uniref:Reverse transcriptase domain-containing protein n=1 Tax=Electrophorus voltai TaxID=2609070 RepID=A0AAD8Z717_9TELE|nr:hypothetical protein P4O66_012485 [Electrophorus voltai]